jgi:threonylcarbamoyladenosine tRNA methylthiotransferase MtaB
MRRVALHTIGCKLNYAETATLGKIFTNEGYKIVDIDDPADIIVINTCSVTGRADCDCKKLVRKAIRNSPSAFIAVMGCYTQLQAEEISKIIGVDLIIGSQNKYSLIDFVRDGGKKSKPEIIISCSDNNFEYASSAGYKDRTRAFIKVQDGCDYNCSFCTVPLARGISRSATIANIIIQAQEAVEQGYKEIVITGVNIGDFGRKDNNSLLLLLKQLVKVDGLIRIRLSSVEPNLLTDELLDFWFSEDKICNHWHIPLQSGSDSILRNMQRRYLTGLYVDRINYIKSHIHNAGIGADVIVGFPGESDAHFAETYEFINDLPLSYIHVFSYSERPNTTAARLLPKINHKIKSDRSEQLRELGVKKRHIFYQQFVGKTVPVLFESKHADGTISGLTAEYVKVNVKTTDNLTNDIVQVNINEAFDDKCMGELSKSNYVSTVGIAI